MDSLTNRQFTVILDKEEHQIDIRKNGKGYELTLGDTTHRFEVLLESSSLFSFLIDNTHVLEADIILNQDRCELNVQNIPYHLKVFDPRRRLVSQNETGDGGGLICSPMPGKIIEVRVALGDPVKKGQAVVVIEAMKMQNELNAPMDGVVKELNVKSGQPVEADQKLVLISKDK